jgi:hypothetical protein
MASLRDVLKGKELEYYLQSASFARPEFQTEQEKIDYYAKMNAFETSYYSGVIAATKPSLGDDLKNPLTIMNNIAQTLRDIETLRSSATIAYFTAFYNQPRRDIYINNRDKEALLGILDRLPVQNGKLDFIIHSPGGMLDISVELVELLRSRFSHISFIIPDKAKSAAALMAMAANEIILYDGASLSPFDPLVVIPPNNEQAQAPFALSIARDAYWRLRYFPFFLEKTYPGWTLQKASAAIDQALGNRSYYETIATLWLTKYMFGHSEATIEDKDRFLDKPRIKYAFRTRADYRKARKIASYFTDSALHIKHEHPLTYSMICNLGLNISQAKGELRGYAEKAYYQMSMALFQTENTLVKEFPYFSKLWASGSHYSYFSET